MEKIFGRIFDKFPEFGIGPLIWFDFSTRGEPRVVIRRRCMCKRCRTLRMGKRQPGEPVY